MGIDYEVCSVCGEGFPDVKDYGFCGYCEETLCEGCLADMQEKYGMIGEKHDNVVNVGEDAPVKCDECTKPQLDVKKFEKLLYFLIKDATRYDFNEFLENAELSRNDYDDIKKHFEYKYGIKMYL